MNKKSKQVVCHIITWIVIISSLCAFVLADIVYFKINNDNSLNIWQKHCAQLYTPSSDTYMTCAERKHADTDALVPVFAVFFILSLLLPSLYFGVTFLYMKFLKKSSHSQ